jgi:hypothetical protein
MPLFEHNQIGNSQVHILVPTRQKDGKVLDPEYVEEWKERAIDEMTQHFGGVTPELVRGTFKHEDGRTTREHIHKLIAAVKKVKIASKKTKKAFFEFAGELCEALGQEQVFVGWGDTSHLIAQEFSYENIPVIAFAELSKNEQLKHLTMGWAGISRPAEILQLLSLDGWTKPEEDSTGTAELTLCGILEETTGIRRAWAWTGVVKLLKETRDVCKTYGLQTGDMVFTQDDDDHILVYMVSGKKLIGPRDLKLSYGELNPVTKHLLMRMLRREWTEILEDLKRKPLHQQFFPKLQKLRNKIEQELLAQGFGGAEGTKPKKGSKSTKTKIKNEISDAAFRESVLIVGRIMFLRFLIQKECVPGGLRMLQERFNEDKDNFFSSWLLPLWFDVFNVEVDNRSEELIQKYGEGIPYLNGGLFEQRSGERKIKLSREIFDHSEPDGFFQLFSEFEFSLNEYEGSEQTLKIDPSFFGKALESFNPDHKKKKHGVHYTPKPIARALAAESIIHRVSALSECSESELRDLLAGEGTIKATKAREIRLVLQNLKIIDPAVGSGVLLWAVLRVLIDLDSACDGIIGKNDGYQPGSNEWGVRSRFFVCNCLYGVDISDEAIELTRLRLWLAVALAEDEPAALPDLELNIFRGDSLLPDALVPVGSIRRPKQNKQLRLPIDETTRLQAELNSKTVQCQTLISMLPDERRECSARIRIIRRKLAQLDEEASGEPGLNWELFFPHVFADETKKGFDIVIANPPYIRTQRIDKSLREHYTNQWKSIAKGNPDLSFAFIELALTKLAAPDRGQIAFIQPNFRHHDAGEFVRDILTGQIKEMPAYLRLWVDFDDAQVFPTASNYVSLLFSERRAETLPQENLAYTNPKQDSWVDPKRGNDIGWLRPEEKMLDNQLPGEWLTVPEDLRKRVIHYKTNANTLLADVAEIGVGIQTSYDSVFLFEDFESISKTTYKVFSQKANSSFNLENGILRKCLKGSAGDDYLLFFPYDKHGTLITEEILSKKFPNAWSYLLQMKESLEGREENSFVGEGWYRFGRSQGVNQCSQPKVLVPSLVNEPTTISDPKGMLAFTASGKGGGGAWAVYPKKDSTLTLELLKEILMSSTTWDYYQAYGSPQLGGWRGVDRGVLGRIPIA